MFPPPLLLSTESVFFLAGKDCIMKLIASFNPDRVSSSVYKSHRQVASRSLGREQCSRFGHPPRSCPCARKSALRCRAQRWMPVLSSSFGDNSVRKSLSLLRDFIICYLSVTAWRKEYRPKSRSRRKTVHLSSRSISSIPSAKI